MVGWILLAILGLIVLAFFVPVRVGVEYLGEWRVSVRLFGTIPVWRYPTHEKPKNEPEAPPTEVKEAPAEQPNKLSVLDEIKALFHEEGVSGVLSFFGKLIQLLKTTLCSLVRFVTVRKLALCVRVGGEEADETAVRYGQISAAAATSLTLLSRLVRVKKTTVRMYPDFTREQSEARLRLIVWVWPFGVVGVGVAALCKLLMLWTKTIKTPQGGVQNTTTRPVSK